MVEYTSGINYAPYPLLRENKKTKYACIVKCEQEKTTGCCFYAARRPKATSGPSRRLAKAKLRDYATVADYNKPLLRDNKTN